METLSAALTFQRVEAIQHSITGLGIILYHGEDISRQYNTQNPYVVQFSRIGKQLSNIFE